MDKSIFEKLKQIPLFDEIKDDNQNMSSLSKIIQIKQYSKGDYIIKEGQIGSEMYIVYHGGVEIQKKTRAGDNYTVVRLKADQNVFFGELALIDDDKRSATVIATEDSTFLVISKKDFIQLGNKNPSIGLPITRAIARILAERLRKTTLDMLTIFDALVSEIQE
jgi:CRP/FNR family cyclic AMP-dependent transcriptional regulator